MSRIVIATLLLLSAVVLSEGFMAGVAKVNATLPVGAPLAGYNHGARRVKDWPLFDFTTYTSWMTPSLGVLDTTWVKALVLDDGATRVCFVTMDLMCADSSLEILAHAFAQAQGFTLPLEQIVFSGSHTHSGPGAWVPQFGIQVTPTMDLFVPALQQMMARSIAQAMVEAERALAPASVGIGMGLLTNVTHNRRAPISPYVTPTTIDPHLGVIRVDSADGTPLATVWNYAMHGVCLGPENLYYSSDIMGSVCTSIEQMGGGVAMFINADAGDVSPNGDICQGVPFGPGGPFIATAVLQVRSNTTTANDGVISTASSIIDFGLTATNWTLARQDNCTQGGPFDICSICEVLHCDLNIKGGLALVEETPRFTAFRITIDSVDTLFVTIPGEAIVELGWQIRNDSSSLGFDQTFLVGYSNNYMMYFTTPNEYVIGGYEASLTLWGIDTSNYVRAGCKQVATKVAPSSVRASARRSKYE